MCDDEDVPQRAGRPREAHEEVGARLVHELNVFDGQHRRGAAKRVDQETERDVGERVAQEALVDAARLGCRRQVEPEQDAEQRHPRNELLVDPGDDLAQAQLGGIRIRSRLEPQRRPHRGAQGEIRRRCFVLLAPRVQHLQVRGTFDEFLDEPRPARTRGAADLDHPTVPFPDFLDHGGQEL